MHFSTIWKELVVNMVDFELSDSKAQTSRESRNQFAMDTSRSLSADESLTPQQRRVIRDIQPIIVKTMLNSIALVATKVDNQYIKQGGNFILVDTCKIIDAIGDFLLEVKDDLKTKSNNNEVEALFCKNAVKFIEVLLAQDAEQYTRIGIFRRPDEPGALGEIALLKEEKNHILRMIHEKLSFTEKVVKILGTQYLENLKTTLMN
ncbi:uncharacterized protein CEXT_200981 [Caerostris extrusa]|uniref:Uncharacterized protein n=1 Tax=Caerostris extrusa TaxID=172846 RepID=A0AAV4MJR8_CAEEX|nr:uncharacterized protein CEXT_200981 [Caerostris extrusa]